jgi:alkanesulfonate monooxygenase SsuD/methylene tetrahydromethanopterin reductase-like flavin-dependent oxidoreductase (luciferase family)
MDFGIVFPSYLEAWKDAAIAEDNGFTYAWFYDSQMLYSDVYVCMALAAEHTKHIKLGTCVAILGNRIAPVTAHSIATINQMAPGRVVLGVGTGFTGRNTMGLPPVPLRTLREQVEQCRGLLRGEEVLYRDGKQERWIRFLHPDRGYINVQDPIPIHIAANGPKALETVGELGDGWITTLQSPESLKQGLAVIRSAAQKKGRQLGDLYVSALTTACITRPGESVLSPRVTERVGPFAIVFYHALWEGSVVAANIPEELRTAYRVYEQEYVAKMKTPEDRRYLEVHEGHLIYLKPGEERFLNEHLIRGSTLTGPGEEIIARLKALEAAGLKNIAVQVVTNGQELIEEFGREVIAKYR